jgi:transcriptional regulator with XRE-family HTH domain
MLFGKKLRELRESKKLVLRKVAAHLDIDTATMSKIERGDRHAKKEHLPILARILGIAESELKTLWLADKVCELVEEEDHAIEALRVAENQIENNYIVNQKSVKV